MNCTKFTLAGVSLLPAVALCLFYVNWLWAYRVGLFYPEFLRSRAPGNILMVVSVITAILVPLFLGLLSIHPKLRHWPVLLLSLAASAATIIWILIDPWNELHAWAAD